MAKKKKKGGKAAYAKGRAATGVSASRVKMRKATRATYKTKRAKPSAGGR